MSYAVKEIFLSLQGEGAQVGRPAVFCRFAGCNLWSGLEQDRAAADCQFCDTGFVGGERFETADKLAAAAHSLWPGKGGPESGENPLAACTGGEPFLQLDEKLINAFHGAGFQVAAETNGTLPAPDGLDWLCVSPKAKTKLVVIRGDELKLVFPQEGAEPELYQSLDFQNFFLQPMDGPDKEKNTELALSYCLAHPKWRLSLQTQKILGIK